MSDKKPSISSLLNKPHLQTVQSTVAPSDPVIPTRIRATLDQVISYKDNPRQTKNPMYDEIKESIRNRGLDHAPNVTRKNPADPYMIKDGGNTRLQILRELWEETGDEKFYTLDLMFHPWTNDLDVLIGHMIENEMRGSMIFIERAIAARKIKTQIEQSESKELSIRELAKRISAEGWSLDQAGLNHMLYAHDFLLPVISEALWSGVGVDRVKKIRKLLDCCRTYWEAVSTPEEGDFDSVWKPVFTKLDGDGFDVAAAEYQLCGEMAKRMDDGPVMSVTAQIQGLLEGIKGLELVRPSRFEPAPIESPAPKRSLVKAPHSPRVESVNQPGNLPSASPNDINADVFGGDQATLSQPINSGVADWGAPVASSQLTQPAGIPFDFHPQSAPSGSPIKYEWLVSMPTASLQNQAYEVALRFARRVGLESNIINTEGNTDAHTGFGITNEGVREMHPSKLAYWMYLCQCAFMRRPDMTRLLGELLCSGMGDDFDPLNIIAMLMDMNYARTGILGNEIRGIQDAFSNGAWGDITELDAIVGIIVTRDYEESTQVDEVPDPTFIGR
jgi:ParB family protein of integrating conjugative element (PFGI_1 class)